jgi:glycosyltransferase involved in cell wall biosynthesis
MKGKRETRDRMGKIAVIGVYGSGEDFTTGQAVKCHTVIDWFIQKYGVDQIEIVNTYQWKKKPLKLLSALFAAFRSCSNIILMPAQNGIKVFAPLCYILNRIYKRKIHYIVIGGWLAEMLSQHHILKEIIAAFSGVYVEAVSMEEKLEKLGLNNIHYMPNSRDYTAREKKENIGGIPLSVCTYSRVVKQKGIADAVEICRRANEKCGTNIFHLDIYGKIAEEFKQELDILLKKNVDIVDYVGCKDADETINVLDNYFALLFPTYYAGEGFAGTILDAFAAEIPVIANDWKYNAEIIKNGINGMIYPYRDLEVASDKLVELYKNPELYKKIQNECKKSALQYSTARVMREFEKNLC